MDSTKINEIVNFLFKKCIIAIAIILVTTVAAIYIGFVADGSTPLGNNIFSLYKDAFDLKAQNEATEINIGKLQAELKKKQNEKKSRENVKEEKVPVVVYKSMRQNAPIESSAVDLVTDVIKTLERTHNTIMDISYNIITSSQPGIPSNISIVQLNMTLNGSYVSFQDFLFELYDDQYISTIKSIKMVPLQENKSILEINTEIWLYISR